MSRWSQVTKHPRRVLLRSKIDLDFWANICKFLPFCLSHDILEYLMATLIGLNTMNYYSLLWSGKFSFEFFNIKSYFFPELFIPLHLLDYQWTRYLISERGLCVIYVDVVSLLLKEFSVETCGVGMINSRMPFYIGIGSLRKSERDERRWLSRKTYTLRRGKTLYHA